MSQEGMQPQQQPQQLAAQIDEIALLRATVAEEEFAWRGTLADAHAWQQHLDGDPDRDRDPVPDPAHRPPPPFAFALRLATDPHPELWLHVELPPRYPATTLADGVDGDVHGDPRAEPTVTLAGPDTSRNELEALQLIMRTRLQEAKDEELDHRIFDLLTALQSHLADHPLSPVSSTTQPQEDALADAAQAQAPVPTSLEMARVIFWTHHLKATGKRKDLSAWSSELNLWGLVKPGYPGFLCFEGIASEVGEIVRRIKSLNWHALSVRSEERYTFNLPSSTDGPTTAVQVHNAALRDCKLAVGHSANTFTGEGKVRTGLEEVGTVGELAERFRNAQIDEQEFLDAVRLRKSAGAAGS